MTRSRMTEDRRRQKNLQIFVEKKDVEGENLIFTHVYSRVHFLGTATGICKWAWEANLWY